MENNYCGFVNIYKEKGYTSHDVVAIVRKTLGRIKVGHTGTLDPDAEGVLPICVGKATKLADYIMGEDKTYIATLKLGLTTDTLDSSGTVLSESVVVATEEEIRQAIFSFVGEYYQTPPMYSAIKINGKKLYELAREGKEIERKRRLIKINNINVLEFIGHDKIIMEINCSKGTYIRSLCDDIGQKLGCGGIMDNLVRTKTGDFCLESSIKIDDFKEMKNANKVSSVILPMETALASYEKVYIDKAANKLLYNGNPIELKFVEPATALKEGQDVVAYDSENNIMGIYHIKKETLKPKVILFSK